MRSRVARRITLSSVAALWLAAVLLAASADAQVVNLSQRGSQLAGDVLPDSIRVLTTPEMLAEDDDDPGSAYLAVGFEDEVSGHFVYLHLDLEPVVQGLAAGDVLDVTIDLTTLDGVASDPSQIVGGEHFLIQVDQQSASAVLRDPGYEETSFCHIPTHDEFRMPTRVYPPYEAAGEELIQGQVGLSYTVNGSGAGALDAQVTIGIYDPALYGGGSTLALTAGEEEPPTCMDDEELEIGEMLATADYGLEEGGGRSTTLAAAKKKKWCLSWYSAQCKKAKNEEGEKYCPADSCNISWARLLGLVTGSLGLSPPVEIVASGSVTLLSEWLEEEGYATAATGTCAKVYLFGAISLGCQCVFHVF